MEPIIDGEVGDINMIKDELSLSVVGSAGRGSDYDNLNLDKYNEMYRVADKLIDYINSKSPTPLTHCCSGGAAWADHLAVRLYLNNRIPNLKLYLPCEYENGEFSDDDVFGRIADTITHYHNQFEKETGQNSLKEIQLAIDKGAEITVINGFKNRNTYVSMSHYILAMTFGETNKVKRGGTFDTISKYLQRVKDESLTDLSFHYNLKEMKMYKGCKL